MKILLLYDYPATPGGLSTQGALLHKGLLEQGIEIYGVHLESAQEKEWYYRWFKPDVVIGVGYWGYTPHLVLHPQHFGFLPVPWLVADGYIANYQEILNALPLILVTSEWVKEMYIRDGIKGDNIEVLPVGCDTDLFVPYDRKDPQVRAVRETLGIKEDQLMILTIGGDATSKGAQEVMQALSDLNNDVPEWRYVCKVWPQPRTIQHQEMETRLASNLGIEKKIIYSKSIISREFMPYLINACDIYAGPSRLEGFGMPQVEAGACCKPVLGIRAMGLLDTITHEETGFLAEVEKKTVLHEVTVGSEVGFQTSQRIIFKEPRTVDYRASIPDISRYLMKLMTDEAVRKSMGEKARSRIVKLFDYRVVAKRLIGILQKRLGLN
jgi:glycosyltransferase involved in cell wall biosynthesis